MQVGATAAVGLVEGGKGISWVVLGKAIIGWVATLIIVGFTSAIFMALGIFTPNLRSLQAINNIKEEAFVSAEATVARVEANACPDLAVGTPRYQVSILHNIDLVNTCLVIKIPVVAIELKVCSMQLEYVFCCLGYAQVKAVHFKQ